MHRKSVLTYGVLIVLIVSILALSSCRSKPSAGQLMMDVTGEYFPIEKIGLFGKDHNFWVFKIRHIDRTSRNTTKLSLKGSNRVTTSRAFGLTLIDPAGYEWDIVGLAELNQTGSSGVSRRDMNVLTYEIQGRMDESSTMALRYISALYKPGDPDFDGSLRGIITKENNEVLYTFESNARLDTYPKPDDGLQVISIYKNDEAVAVIDSRDGYEITFFEGLQPTERTQLATTISTLFVLMKYGII